MDISPSTEREAQLLAMLRQMHVACKDVNARAAKAEQELADLRNRWYREVVQPAPGSRSFEPPNQLIPGPRHTPVGIGPIGADAATSGQTQQIGKRPQYAAYPADSAYPSSQRLRLECGSTPHDMKLSAVKEQTTNLLNSAQHPHLLVPQQAPGKPAVLNEDGI